MPDTPRPGTGLHLPAPAVFLGALASEVNEPDVLSPAFAAVADLTERIVAAVRSSVLAERDAAGYLRQLRLTDSHGVQWCVGATSLRWYRKLPDRAWRLAVPPQDVDAACEQSSSSSAVGSLPAEVLDLIGATAGVWEGGGYAEDPFSAPTPAPAPWEYEVGDDRQMQQHSYGDGSFPLPGI